jgi:lysophospholipid acyltransferase (LPLAT)-like uncharacterized protein
VIAIAATLAIIASMNSKHTKTLAAIFANPVNGNLEWSRIESLLVGLGCRVVEGSGSSVTFEKGGEKVFFHRPHPGKEALRYRVSQAREFLNNIGVKP